MAARNAGVWCTIVGLSAKSYSRKLLFEEHQVRVCDNISPYLIPGSNIICKPRDSAISDLKPMKMGSNAVDGKCLVLDTKKAQQVLTANPNTERFIRSYGGTKEIVSGLDRYCVWITDEEAEEACNIEPINEIVEACRIYRMSAGRDARKAARRPHAFCYSTYEDSEFIHVGNTIGNLFDYVPAVIRPRGYVSNHNAFTIYGSLGPEFAIIVSTLHRVWAEAIAGRLGNGTRYGNTVVYNTFPVPTLTEQNKADLTRCAEDILLAREHYFPATIAEMYDPERMDAEFPLVREAHERNDETLERIYIGRRFKNDTERLEKLFELYTKMTARKR